VLGCDNPELLRSVAGLHRHLMRYRTILQLTEMSGERLRFIHEELMQVALDRDAEAAVPIMRRHVKVNLDLVCAGIEADPELRLLIEADRPAPDGRSDGAP
jgi:DNA-binding GntR family transcriptional regulator